MTIHFSGLVIIPVDSQPAKVTHLENFTCLDFKVETPSKKGRYVWLASMIINADDADYWLQKLTSGAILYVEHGEVHRNDKIASLRFYPKYLKKLRD